MQRSRGVREELVEPSGAMTGGDRCVPGRAVRVTAVTTRALTPVVRRARSGAATSWPPTSAGSTSGPTAALGGVAMWFGVLAGLAAAATLRHVRPGVRHARRSPSAWRPAATVVVRRRLARRAAQGARQRRVGAGQDRRAGARRQHPLPRRRQHGVLPGAVPRDLRPQPRPVGARHRVLGRRHGQRHQPHRRPRRPGRRHHGHRRRLLLPLRRCASTTSACSPPATSARSSPSIVLGICLGFLPYNFHPARIFMGDCGALLLGLLMAASTMSVGGPTDAAFSGQTFFFFAPLFIPLVILGVPILDTAFAIVRRAARRSGVATADKEHLHHRLMRSATASAGPCSSSGRGRRCCRASCCSRPHGPGRRPRARSPSAASALALYTVLHPSVRAAATRRRTTRDAVGPRGGRAAGSVDRCR